MRDPAEPLSPSTAQILVAVVMEAFEAGSESGSGGEGPYRLSPNAMDEYLTEWNLLDVDGRQFLDQKAVVLLIAKLTFPLGLKGDRSIVADLLKSRTAAAAEGADAAAEAAREARRKSLAEQRIVFAARTMFRALPLTPNKDDLFHFHAVLHALMDRASGGSPLGVPTGDVELGGSGENALLSMRMMQRLVIIQRRIKFVVRTRKLERAAREAMGQA